LICMKALVRESPSALVRKPEMLMERQIVKVIRASPE
jgi:hypothetical protein